MEKKFVPDHFEVPTLIETDQFRLRMLSVDDVEKDHEAVMETQAHFHRLGSRWPRDGFTLEENLDDLQRHQDEFLKREAFAYTVVTLDESRVLGCLYIEPARVEGADAEAWVWARTSEFDRLDQPLFTFLKDWLATAWPFEKVIYPYREDPPLIGGCLCGAIRYVLSEWPFAAEYCHCRMCQLGSGSPFVAWMDVKADQVKWRYGEPKVYASSESGLRGFCDQCGTTLTFRDTNHPKYYTFSIASLDNPNLVKPTYHIYTDSQVDWLTIDDDCKRYG